MATQDRLFNEAGHVGDKIEEFCTEVLCEVFAYLCVCVSTHASVLSGDVPSVENRDS